MKDLKKKMMPVALTLVLLLSSIVVIVPPSVFALGGSEVFPDGDTTKVTGLTCGEEVTYKVTDSTLWAEHDYVLWYTNDTADVRAFISTGGTDPLDSDTVLYEIEREEANIFGDISITFNVPSEANLDVDPLGTWTLILQNDSSGEILDSSYDQDLTVTKLYTVKMKYDDNWLDYLLYNTTYTPIYMYVYNWTGSRLEIVDDIDLDITLDNADGDLIAQQTGITTGIWDLDITDEDLSFRNENIDNLEYYLNVTVNDSTHITHAVFPVLLAVTADYPSNAEWGDTLTVTGYVRDGQGNGIPDYNVALFAPTIGGTYELTGTTATFSTGRFSLSVETGYDVYPDDFNAGTWYIGTWDRAGDMYRVSERDIFEYPVNTGVGFLRYYWFDVASDDSADVDIVSPDEIIDGFAQEINITADWNGEPFDIYDPIDPDYADDDSADGPAAVHITGIEAYDNDAGEYIHEDEYYYLGDTQLNSDYDESYYVCNLTFQETGTGTFVVTWPDDSGDYNLNDEYKNQDYKPNIIGTVNFQVGNAADINMIVSNMPDEVLIDDSDGDCWKNISNGQLVTVEIYGDEEDDPINAALHVSGCGLDFTIDEDDTISGNEYLYAKAEGYYQIWLNPKIGGVVTITATNDTDNVSVSKDFSVSGLRGTVTTSDGNDKEISVKSSETITVTITNGEYAEVRVGYFDENWNKLDCAMYKLTGDGETSGEGLNGIFEFEIEKDDIEDGVGYIVVVGSAAGFWMYDIVEVAPVHDLSVEVVEPVNWSTNMAFTVGYDHDDWALMIYDSDGEEINDVDEVYAVLVDDDHDEDEEWQVIHFKERTGQWVPDDPLMPWFPGQLIITAVNNSGENEHDGNVTFDVDYATVTYNPDMLTAAIDLENITVEIAVVDANGEPMPEGTDIYLNVENDTGDLEIVDYDFKLDDGGIGEFEIREVGDLKTWINVTLDDEYWGEPDYWEYGNLTAGNLMIEWPIMDIDPETIFIGQPNTVTITATDYKGDPIEGLNLTLWTGGTSFGTPDPVMSDADGNVVFSIQPEASGKANVTIARDIEYVNGRLTWDINNSIITDTYLTITSMRAMKISVSKSPIYQGDTLTVTVTSNGVGVANADVEFAGTTMTTDATGKATFTVPDPGVESAIYSITAEKTGYLTVEKSITVIKIYVISAITPSSAPNAGEEFTITIVAKGMPLAGAEVTFNGKTTMSGGDGKLTLTAPSTAGDYPLTATYEGYGDYSTTITIKEGGGVPGFELLTLIAAIGVAFILLRRKR